MYLPFSTLSVISHIDLFARSLFRPSRILFELLGSLKKNLLPLFDELDDIFDDDLERSKELFLSCLTVDFKLFTLLLLAILFKFLDLVLKRSPRVELKRVEASKRCISALNVSLRDQFVEFMSKSVNDDRISLLIDLFDEEDEVEEDDEDEDEVSDERSELSEVFDDVS